MARENAGLSQLMYRRAPWHIIMTQSSYSGPRILVFYNMCIDYYLKHFSYADDNTLVCSMSNRPLLGVKVYKVRLTQNTDQSKKVEDEISVFADNVKGLAATIHKEMKLG